MKDLAGLIQFGASPRAGINLVKAAKAHAFLAGRAYVLPEDVKAMVHDTIRHRLIPTYQAEADGVTADQRRDGGQSSTIAAVSAMNVTNMLRPEQASATCSIVVPMVIS